jgi:hypothetical protein
VQFVADLKWPEEQHLNMSLELVKRISMNLVCPHSFWGGFVFRLILFLFLFLFFWVSLVLGKYLADATHASACEVRSNADTRCVQFVQ